MSQPEEKENLPEQKGNLPSGNEIATLAAVLLGASRVTAPGGGYAAAKAQDIAQACRDALDLLTAADLAADEIKKRGRNRAGFWVLDVFEERMTANEETTEWLEKPAEKLPPDIRKRVADAGWDGGPLGPDDRLPWDDFSSRFMFPKRPREKREERFRGWLKDLCEYTPRELDATIRSYRRKGIERWFFITYLEFFPDWWKEQRSLINRKGGDALRQKLLEEKKKEERKRLAQIQNGTAAGDVGKKKAPKKKTQKKPSA
jgi:hypothetical protein